MVKTKMLIVRLTEEQEQLLESRAKTAGFYNKSEYVRTIIFQEVKDGT